MSFNNYTAFIEDEGTILASQIVGYIGGATVICLQIPQIVLSFRTKSVQNVSMASIFLNLFAGTVFVLYGVLINQWPLIVTNAAYIVVSFIMLGCLCTFGSKKEEENAQEAQSANGAGETGCSPEPNDRGSNMQKLHPIQKKA